MATPTQITANRANAQNSTGPRSVEGKSVSRFNALKHGIDAASIVIPVEDPADYDDLADHYLQEFRPQILPRRCHAPRRLAEGPPPARRGRSLPHRPRRIARNLPRRRTPRRVSHRQPPRPRPAPDRRLRTPLAPRKYRPPAPPRKSRVR